MFSEQVRRFLNLKKDDLAKDDPRPVDRRFGGVKKPPSPYHPPNRSAASAGPSGARWCESSSRSSFTPSDSRRSGWLTPPLLVVIFTTKVALFLQPPRLVEPGLLAIE
jgi:hypothetical protein